MIISNDIFKSYLCCEYKAFLKNNCVQGNNTDYRDFLSQRKNEFRIKTKKLLIKNFDVKDAFIKEFSNSSDLKRGKKLLLGATIKFRDIQAHVDALEKVKVNSALGSYSYRPYLFIPKNRICKQEKLLLAYIGYTLGLIQKNDIEHGFLLYGESFKRNRINLTKYHHTIAVLIEELRTILANDKQPKLLLNRHCPICEFQLDCDKEARSTDNLSLLRGMKEKEIKALNSKGIFTVTQFSFTFRPKKRRKRETNLIKRRYHALQALAIREQKLIVYGKPCIPTSSVCMYMDLETDPLRDFVYLIGLIISDNDDIKKYSFWADSPNEESKIVKEFLKVLNNFDEFILFHYGNIETKYIKSLLRADKGINKSVLEKILKNSINLLSIIYKHFYFPVYENSLKNIAGYIGIKWSEELSSGLKSIVVREQWEKSWSIDIKKILVKYNMEDCYATKSVLEYLCKVSSDDWKYKNKDVSKTLFDDDLKIRKGHMFGKNKFVIKDYNYINKCSYFDYQRKKIYVRTDKALKKRLNRNDRKKRLDVKINKIIKIDCLHLCPNCGSKKLHRRGYVPSTLIDLKFFPSGVKRWSIKYHQYRFNCLQCKMHFTVKPPNKVLYKRYGHGLISWTIFENITKGVSFRKIQLGIEELFKIQISHASLHNFKLYASKYYEGTYKEILHKILNSSGPVHVDETPVKLSKTTGYVWVFTNTVEVAFIFRPTREGEFLKKYLDGFKGVLISDYYGAYDSLCCVQQKCLIHLIRDLNSDLQKVPFDEEFKSFVQTFGRMLKKIVETIDRYGLKKRYLRKHKKDVEEFNKLILNKNYSSEYAIQYQKRFKKNNEKLFCFLNYDGVSWNNNNAEYAFKHFAVYRHKVNGTFTENGLKAYLVLLSIYQTCQYKQLSFLEFLLSGKREI